MHSLSHSAVEELPFEADADCRGRAEDAKQRNSAQRRRAESRDKRFSIMSLKGSQESGGRTLVTKWKTKELGTAASGRSAVAAMKELRRFVKSKHRHGQAASRDEGRWNSMYPSNKSGKSWESHALSSELGEDFDAVSPLDAAEDEEYSKSSTMNVNEDRHWKIRAKEIKTRAKGVILIPFLFVCIWWIASALKDRHLERKVDAFLREHSETSV